jgi:hypothetical protein
MKDIFVITLLLTVFVYIMCMPLIIIRYIPLLAANSSVETLFYSDFGLISDYMNSCSIALLVVVVSIFLYIIGSKISIVKRG